MTTLREAAQQALEAWDGGDTEWFKRAYTVMEALRAALAEPEYPLGRATTDVGVPVYVLKKAEPVQEPVAGRAFLERILAAMEGVIDVADRKTDEFDALRSCVIDLTLMLHTAPPQRPAEPVQEPVAWKLWDEDPQGGGDWRYYDAKDFKNGINPMEYFDGLVPLYTAPPQRKPLSEEEIDSIWDSEKAFADIYAITRAVERAHGIT